MSRRRYISTEISIDKYVNQMGVKYGDAPVLLYTWMIPHAQDDATMNGDPYELLGMVWPQRRDKTEDDVVRALEQMEEFNLIVWDRTARVVYFPVHSFYKYQTYIKKENRRTAENAEERRTSAENAVSLSLSLSPSLSHSLSRDSDHAPSDLDTRIQKFYERTMATMPTAIQVSRISYWCDTKGMEENLIYAAIQKAADKQKDLDYIVGILRKQFERGVRTVADAGQDDARYQSAAGGERVGSDQGYHRTSSVAVTKNKYRRDTPGAY